MNNHTPSMTWVNALSGFPYVTSIRSDGSALQFWRQFDHSRDTNWKYYEQALNLYLNALGEEQPLLIRAKWLNDSLDLLEILRQKKDDHSATEFLALRLLFETGDSTRINTALDFFAQKVGSGLRVQIDRPFLPPIAEYDNKVVQGSIYDWLKSAIKVALNKRSALSLGSINASSKPKILPAQAKWNGDNNGEKAILSFQFMGPGSICFESREPRAESREPKRF